MGRINNRDSQIFNEINRRKEHLKKISWSDCFAEGAKWADSNPGWRKYPDEVPPDSREGVFVEYLTCYRNGDICVDAYDSRTKTFGWMFNDEGNYQWNPNSGVIAWMPKPKPIKTDNGK